MSRFERKFGKYAIRNLSLVLIGCYIVGYLMEFLAPTFLGYLSLSPYAILHGQVWRLVTWVFIPPTQSNIIFIIIMLLFYASIGQALERTWGSYRYNVYFFQGMLFTILGSFLYMAYLYVFRADALSLQGLFSYTVYGVTETGVSGYFLYASTAFSTYYINMSIFLAYAATFPDMRVLLMFFIPIKVKWLGLLYAALLIYEFIVSGLVVKFAIVASLLNFVLFFFTSRKAVHRGPKQMRRQHEFRKQTKTTRGVTKHKCAICGKTELDDPEMEFRFCSKCEGNYEYCADHIYTHTHIKRTP